MPAAFHSPRYERFQERLRRAREEAGLTQADVARALGRPQSFVSKCESGERRVDAVELEDFARLYGQPCEYFWGGRQRDGISLVAETRHRPGPRPRKPR